MERVYRGYPQGLNGRPQPEQSVQRTPQPKAAHHRPEHPTGGKQPYMIYDKGQPQPTSAELRRRKQAEQSYFKGLYPMSARRPQRYVEEEFDRIDIPGSPMYDEYPDREQIYRLRDRIADNTERTGRREDRDLILVLLLNEMLRRRAGI